MTPAAFEDSSLFVLRRAWLFGICRRKDIDAVFGTASTPARASRIIKKALAQYPLFLQWHKNHGIRPNPDVKVPHEATATVIMRLLSEGKEVKETGIFPSDGLPRLMPQPLEVSEERERLLQSILQASLKDQPLEILYVGLRKGETARWRRVWPSALEFTGMQWRLHAQDMDDQKAVIKVYVLGRILDARYLTQAVDKTFSRRKIIAERAHFRVELNPELTPEQQTVLRQNFGIDAQQRMSWPSYALHEFKRDYAEMPVSKDTVWPIISKLESLD